MSRGLGNKPCTEAQLEQAIGPSWDCSTEEYCREQSISFGAFSCNGVDGQLCRACRSFMLDLELAT